MNQNTICENAPMAHSTFLSRAIARLAMVSVMLIFAGCTQTAPYRTTLNPVYDRPFCESNASGVVDNEECRNVTPEVSRSYELHFVEFDDQGWLHQESFAPGHNSPKYCPQNSHDSTEQVMTGDAYCQLENLKHRLDELAQNGGVSIVLYVHGWHHNAELKDSNVQNFRQLLSATSAAEQAKQKKDHDYHPKKVVGIYVGWRGESVSLFPLNYLTIWDRKNTAMHVAQGSSRELFTWLNAYQKRNNESGDKKVRLILIGHSLGSLVVYSAVSGYLMEQLNDQLNEPLKPGKCDKTSRFADMVLLINPAQEGARYEPLYRMANDPGNACLNQQEYQTPLLVTVTTKTDWATGAVFPMSRVVSTFWEGGTSEQQSRAIRKTYGHLDDYITHDLNPISDCANTGNNMQAASQSFCLENGGEGVRLDRRKTTPFNVPIWNIQADSQLPSGMKPIIDGHNGIMEKPFINFIQKLYHDTAR